MSGMDAGMAAKIKAMFTKAGAQGIAGLVVGLTANTSTPIDAASDVGIAVIAALKAAMGVASPSIYAE